MDQGRDVFDKQKFLGDMAQVSDGNYATAIKMLGFVQYVSEVWAEGFLSGRWSLPEPITGG